MSEKRRFRGPGGGLFVPHHTVDESTIRMMVDSGEWTPVDDEPKKAAPAKKTVLAKKAAGPAAKPEQ